MKLVKSIYQKGFSTVTLKHNGKFYVGGALYNEEEEKNPPSSFFGQRLAEKRAMIEYWKDKRDINRIKEQALKSLLKDLEPHIQDGVLEEGLYEIILEKLEQHIKYYNKEVKDCKKQIDYLKQEIKESLKIREQLFNKVKNS